MHSKIKKHSLALSIKGWRECYHRHTNHGVGRSMDDGMGLWATSYELGTGTNKARNFGNWERRDYELRKLGLTREHEDKYKDQGDTMAWNEETRIIYQWLALNPFIGIKEVTSIYIMNWGTCIRIFWRIFWNLLEPSRTF